MSKGTPGDKLLSDLWNFLYNLFTSLLVRNNPIPPALRSFIPSASVSSSYQFFIISSFVNIRRLKNRELLAVVLALQKWSHWLEWSILPFVGLTDHENLSYLQIAKCLTSRQAWPTLCLAHFFVLTQVLPATSRWIPCLVSFPLILKAQSLVPSYLPPVSWEPLPGKWQ